LAARPRKGQRSCRRSGWRRARACLPAARRSRPRRRRCRCRAAASS
jgi:hypothetical protein